MSKIQSQPVGTCEVCGKPTDFTSPLVCYGCVMEAQEESDASVATSDQQIEALSAAIIEKFDAKVIPF